MIMSPNHEALQTGKYKDQMTGDTTLPEEKANFQPILQMVLEETGKHLKKCKSILIRSQGKNDQR